MVTNKAQVRELTRLGTTQLKKIGAAADGGGAMRCVGEKAGVAVQQVHNHSL